MNRTKLTRIIALILAAVMVLSIFAGTVFAADGPELIISDSEKASVGIIGGADGPTAILVSGNPIALITAAVAAVAIIVFIIRKRRK